METRANYVAVGAFVMLCIIGLIVALFWLAHIQFRQEYAYYQTSFAGAVTGLGPGTIVRYNGIDVGHVKSLDFDPDDPRRVISLLEVRKDLVLHENSTASIEQQGLTGGSYVEITGGTKESAALEPTPGQPYPVIASRSSSLQALFESTPDLIARLRVISDRVADVLSDQNRASITKILSNLQETTAVFARRAPEIDSLITDGSETMHNLAAASRSLDQSLAQLQAVLQKAGGASDRLSEALVSANETAKKMTKLTSDLDEIVGTSKPQLKAFTGEGMAQMTQLIGETRGLVASLTRLSGELEREPSRVLFGDRRQGYTPQ